MSLRLKWRGEGDAGELISFRFHCEPPSAARMCFPTADPGSRAGVSLSHAFTSGPAKPESLLLKKKKKKSQGERLGILALRNLDVSLGNYSCFGSQGYRVLIFIVTTV